MKKAPAKMKKSAAKMKKAPAKMKKSPAKKPSDLDVGNRENLPDDLKAKIAAAKMKKSAMKMGKSKATPFKLKEVNSPMKCWKGYKRTPGTKKGAKGSCYKPGKKKK